MEKGTGKWKEKRLSADCADGRGFKKKNFIHEWPRIATNEERRMKKERKSFI
jgi:hypothetical protein